jgi:hypothetical protein
MEASSRTRIGRAFVGAVLIGEKHPRMLRQVDDGEIAVVVALAK